MTKLNIDFLLNSLKKHINLEEVPSRESRIQDIYDRLEGGTFISYAQNYEDVILNRIFQHKQKGIYVDIGAYHPYEKSVTCLFSKRGWTGVNIDLCRENISRFEIHRPQDTNICSAVGSKSCKEDFYVQRGTTRTTKDKALGQAYKNRGVEVKVESHNVLTLTELLSKTNIKDIDFLSVDVEGSELDVFSGINFDIYKPTVILAEATYPETSIPNWKDWNHILESAGYDCVYFDGLNRFYIQKNNSKLKDFFKVPPNYFDNFIRYENIINLLSDYSNKP
jgi:FkbM family methyltransferase